MARQAGGTSADVQLMGRQLLVHGHPVILGARAFDVLSVLLKNRNRVVMKRELLDAVWPGLVVEENNLQVQISALRKVLGHDAIATIPGQGYQFTGQGAGESDALPGSAERAGDPAQDALAAGPITVPALVAQASAPMSAAALAPSPAPVRNRGIRAGVALIVVLLLAAACVTWLWPGLLPSTIGPGEGPVAPTIDRSVAVLPFADMSEKKDLEYFSEGLSEEVLHLLSKVPELRVAARTSSFSFKGKSDDLPTIARKLQVGNVLEGSVRRSGNEVRITAQLVRADNGYHLWSQTYDRKLGEIFQIQEEIAASVVQALQLSLIGEGLPKSTGAKSMEAYTLYLQGRALQMHASTKADWDGVDEYARRAVSADVNFAPAWAFFSRSLSDRAELGFIPGENGWDAARQAATRSLSLDPNLAEAELAIASIALRYDWDWLAAQGQIDAVLAQDPGNALAMCWAGHLALVLGQKDRAVAFYEHATAIDPLDPNKYRYLAQALYLNGRLADAQIVLHKALALDSGQAFAHGLLARVALARGDAEGALAEWEHEPNEAARLMGRAIAFHALGRRSDSDTALAALEKNYSTLAGVSIATAHAYRGETERAFAWLQRGYDQRNTDSIFVKVEPLLAGLHRDARFAAFLKKLKLPA